MRQERNSDQIAGLVLDWLERVDDAAYAAATGAR